MYSVYVYEQCVCVSGRAFFLLLFLSKLSTAAIVWITFQQQSHTHIDMPCTDAPTYATAVLHTPRSPRHTHPFGSTGHILYDSSVAPYSAPVHAALQSRAHQLSPLCPISHAVSVASIYHIHCSLIPPSTVHSQKMVCSANTNILRLRFDAAADSCIAP